MIDGAPPPAPGQIPLVDYRSATPGYFSMMGIPLLRGRDVAWGDTPTSEPVIAISDAMARKFWPNQDALGKRIRRNASAPWVTVVGIVGDVQHTDLVHQPRPAMYLPP